MDVGECSHRVNFPSVGGIDHAGDEMDDAILEDDFTFTGHAVASLVVVLIGERCFGTAGDMSISNREVATIGCH